MEQEAGGVSEASSNGSFGLALLAACAGSAAGLVGTAVLGAQASSWTVVTLCLLVMLAVLFMVCIHAGRKQAWARLWGVVAGVLLAIALLVAGVFCVLSGLGHAGF